MTRKNICYYKMFTSPDFRIYGDARTSNLRSRTIQAVNQLVIPHIATAADPPVIPGTGNLAGAGLAFNDATSTIFFSTGSGPWLPVSSGGGGSNSDIFGGQLTGVLAVPNTTETSVTPYTLLAPALYGVFAGGVYTASLDQKITFAITISWAPGFAGGSRYLRIYSNGVLVAQDITDPDTSGVNPTTHQSNISLTLNSGDNVEARVYQDSGVGLTILSGVSTTMSSSVVLL